MEQGNIKDWYKITASETARLLDTDPSIGLSQVEAGKRLEQYGANELVERSVKSPWRIFWEQFNQIIVILLIIADAVSFFLGEYQDGIAILAIVIMNAILGFRQEYKAEKAMAALKKLSVPLVRVRRNGETAQITAADLVPGDAVLLDAGARVPADCRIVESANLRVEEASLTGESEPVEKSPVEFPGPGLPLAERSNMVFMGTSVSFGRGTCLVTGTGMGTELGSIAEMIQGVHREPTPLQKRLEHLGKTLIIISLVLVCVIFVEGLWREGFSHLRELFMIAVSMSVAAVPEGLPAVVTIALALGAQRMLGKKALIRKLLAVETLGSVTVICSDKTGTLTQNQMTVQTILSDGDRLDFPEQGPLTQRPDAPAAFRITFAGGALCNDSELHGQDESGRFDALGDPTENALLIAAARAGLLQNDLFRAFPRVAEAPFDADRRRMTTVHRVDDPSYIEKAGLAGAEPKPAFIAFTKGAVDGLVQIADRILTGEGITDFNNVLRQRVQEEADRLSGQGMRLLGVAYKTLDKLPESVRPEILEQHLVFAGIEAMIDPARPEAKDAVAKCKTAGIRIVMITGDHPLTAATIGKKLGILKDGGRTVSGMELEGLTPSDFSRVVDEADVFARISPAMKLAIVESLQAMGHVAAMTGDGVNDAPALKKADIGVAMGITGTDVSKESSDMVLLDDNFATIVAAVEEGRIIYDNIRKFIKFLMTTNSAELWLMLLAPFFGMPLPLFPLQILWMNLLTDGLPALALGVEPAEKNIMRRPPTLTTESIFGRGMGVSIIWVGMVMGAVALGTGLFYWLADGQVSGVSRWQTMTFTVITLSQMANVMAIRAGTESLFTAGIFSNKPLLLAVLTTLLLHLLLLYVPFFREIFKVVPLSLKDLGIAILLSSVVFWVVEIEKFFQRRKAGSARPETDADLCD